MNSITLAGHGGAGPWSPATQRGEITASRMLAGGVAAFATLMLWPPGLGMGALALLYLVALLSARALVWDFIIHGQDRRTLGCGLWGTGLGFATVYVLGLTLLATPLPP